MFKDRLRSARIARGLTLQKVADKANVSLRTYQNYESGDREPSYHLLVTFADIYNVPVDFLLGRDEYLASMGISVDVPPEGPPRQNKGEKRS